MVPASVTVDESWSILTASEGCWLTDHVGQDIRDVLPGIKNVRPVALAESMWHCFTYDSRGSWLRVSIPTKLQDNTRRIGLTPLRLEEFPAAEYRQREGEMFVENEDVLRTVAIFSYPRLGVAVGVGIFAEVPSLTMIKEGKFGNSLRHELKAAVWEGYNRAVLYRFMKERQIGDEWLRAQRKLPRWSGRSNNRRQDYQIVGAAFPELDIWYPSEPIKPLEVLLHSVQALYDSLSEYPDYRGIRKSYKHASEKDTEKYYEFLMNENPLSLEGDALSTWAKHRAVEAARASSKADFHGSEQGIVRWSQDARFTTSRGDTIKARRDDLPDEEFDIEQFDKDETTTDLYAKILADLFSTTRADIAVYWLVVHEGSLSTHAALKLLAGMGRDDAEFGALRKYVERSFTSLNDKLRQRLGHDPRVQDAFADRFGVVVTGPAAKFEKQECKTRVLHQREHTEITPEMIDPEAPYEVKNLGSLWGKTIEQYYEEIANRPADQPIGGIAIA